MLGDAKTRGDGNTGEGRDSVAEAEGGGIVKVAEGDDGLSSEELGDAEPKAGASCAAKLS